MTGKTGVRRAVAGDLDAIHAIELASFTDPWRREGFRELLLGGGARVMVAERDGAIVGFSVWQAAADEAEVLNVAVAASARRTGVARALLREVVDSATAAGARQLFLDVRESNAAARALYGAFGFSEVGRRRAYYDRPREDAIVLRRDAGAAT